MRADPVGDVAEIVAKLTEAQRLFLRDLPAYAAATYSPAKWLVARGLATRSNTGWFIATPLGLAVRSHLENTHAR